jgi:hypothetical protein
VRLVDQRLIKRALSAHFHSLKSFHFRFFASFARLSSLKTFLPNLTNLSLSLSLFHSSFLVPTRSTWTMCLPLHYFALLFFVNFFFLSIYTRSLLTLQSYLCLLLLLLLFRRLAFGHFRSRFGFVWLRPAFCFSISGSVHIHFFGKHRSFQSNRSPLFDLSLGLNLPSERSVCVSRLQFNLPPVVDLSHVISTNLHAIVR